MHKTDRAEGTAQSDDPTQARTTVYYDGSCPLCSVEIGHYASCQDADRLRFVDVSKSSTPLGPDLTQQDAMRRFHVRRTDGELVSGARGFVELWAQLPRWRWLARVAKWPGVLPVLELVYRGFLPLRPILSRVATWGGAKPVNQTDRST